MFEHIFTALESIDTFFWGYIGFSAILLLGLYFTIKTKAFQIRVIPRVFKTFFHLLFHKTGDTQGTHPLKVFFASVGGMIGVGNIVGIVTAIQIGGPGALLWVWIAGFLGSIIKYSEVFLGLKYRISNEADGYDGGSIYFLLKAFKTPAISLLVSALLCVYGTEIYQFTVLSNCITLNWNIPYPIVVATLLGLIYFAVLGGIKRVSQISAYIIPVFTLTYIAMGAWVLFNNLSSIPTIFQLVFKNAFTTKGTLGGLAGGSILLALQQGVSRAVYSADIGIGYDSIIQSESSVKNIINQARLSIFGVLLDNLVCTCTILVALCTNLTTVSQINPSIVVQTAFAKYFPFQNIFMPIFIMVLVYSTLTSYLVVGFKCAKYIHKAYGPKIYLFFSLFLFIAFSFLDQSKALLIMSLSGCMLLCINLTAIFILRNEVVFEAQEDYQETNA